jgi:ACS family tartrate transporter-like MFS transporter
MTSIEHRVVTKVWRRFIPFLVLCFFVSYLDKVNVGFAALSMNRALSMTPAEFGFGAGIFFVTYSILEVPSNLALVRFGARRWLARIMMTWGVVSAATALVRTPSEFYLVRVILGAAEAGFFPGIIFFLTLWFPAQCRARVIGWFMIAIPLSSLIGAPLSGLLLRVDAFGLAAWQWLFVLEAAPAILLGFLMLRRLTDRPAEAAWLEDSERMWLEATLGREGRERAMADPAYEHARVWRVFTDPKVLALAVVYFGTTGLHQAMSFWLPQIVKSFGFTNTETGFVTSVPYLFGAIGMILWGRRSDRHMERKGHAAFALGVATFGFAASAVVAAPSLKLVCLSLAAIGVFGSLPAFWALPSAFLAGRTAAGAIAFINCLGSLSGFVAPWAIGRIRQGTGGFEGGLLTVAAMGFGLACRFAGASRRAQAARRGDSGGQIGLIRSDSALDKRSTRVERSGHDRVAFDFGRGHRLPKESIGYCQVVR